MSASFSNGDRPYITVDIMGRDGQFHAVRGILDSITGDARLYWKEGDALKFGTMEDLFLAYNDTSNHSGFKILSVRRRPDVIIRKDRAVLCANNIEPYFQPIKAVIEHGIRPVWQVTLHNGKRVQITEDHSLLCSTGYSKGICTRKVHELTGVISIDNYGIDTASQHDKELLTLMGLWVADGSIARTWTRGKKHKNLSAVNISTGNNPKILQWLKDFSARYKRVYKWPSVMEEIQNGASDTQLLQEYNISKQQLASVKGEYKHGGLRKKETRVFRANPNGDIQLCSVELAKTIHAEFGDTDCYTKRVPNFLYTASNEEIAAFLRGYFSGDGSIHLCNQNPNSSNAVYGAYYAVDCSSVSRELLEDISVLLDRLGIKHNISTPSKGGGYKNTSLQYKLIIHQAPAVDKFVHNVGFIKEFMYKPRAVYRRDLMLRPVSLLYSPKCRIHRP